MRSTRENGGFTVFCDDCGSRVVWIKGDCLVVKRKHHGQAHITVIPLKDLAKLIEAGEIRTIVRSTT